MTTQDMKTGFNIYKMAILKVSLLTFVAGALVFQTSMNGLKWELLSGMDRFMILLGVTIAMANNVVSFIDKTMSRIEQEQKDLQTQSETTSVTVSQATTPPPQPSSGAATSPAGTGAGSDATAKPN